MEQEALQISHWVRQFGLQEHTTFQPPLYCTLSTWIRATYSLSLKVAVNRGSMHCRYPGGLKEIVAQRVHEKDPTMVSGRLKT